MNTKRLFDAGSVVALIALIAFGIFAVAGGLGGSETKASDNSAREAACLAGSEDCDDTGGSPLGICAAETEDGECTDTFDQPADGGRGGDGISGLCLAPEPGVEIDLEKPCDDTPDGGTSVNPVCAPDYPDCSDTCSVSSSGDVDCGSGGGSDGSSGSSAPGFPGCANNAECERLAVDAAWSLLENDGVSGEITLEGVKSVEWPNACLGVTEPDTACAEVITPGFVVTLERNGLHYVFNTDTNGNAVANGTE